MTDKLLQEFETHVESWELIPSEGGIFEVVVNGELVFSKKALKRHAEIEEVQAMLAEKINANN